MTPAAPGEGLTLVEVLVAIALFAVLGTALSSVWLSALRMTAAADAAAARSRALEPYTLPAALVRSPPPGCDETGAADAGGEAGLAPCLEGSARCRPAGNTLTCGEGGELARYELRLPPSPARDPGAAGAAAPERLTVWARVPP